MSINQSESGEVLQQTAYEPLPGTSAPPASALVTYLQSEPLSHSLLHIAERLNSTSEVDTLLDILIQEAIALIGAQSGCAGLYTPEGMVCHKYFQGKCVLPLEYCWPPNHGLPGWLIVHKVPYLTNDALSDQQIVHELCLQFGVRSALSIPILDAHNDLLGFFELHNKQGNTGFTSSDQETLLALSHLASIALSNALAFQRLQQANRLLHVEIADRRKAEAALQASEERFRALIEHSYDVILLSNREGNYFYASPSLERVLGYTPEEFVQLNGFTLIHPDDIPSIAQAFQTLLATPGLSETRQFRGRHKNGSWRWVEATATNLLHEPDVQAIVTNFHDITEHKQAEEAQRLLAAIVASSDDAIVSKSLEGVITSWNEAAAKLFGYTAEEAIGRHISLIIPPELQAEEEEIIAKIRKGMRIEHYETVRVTKDGRKIDVSLSISPVKDSQGRIIGAAKIARDITEHKRLEAKFRRLFDSNLIGVFVSDFAGTFLDANDAFLDLLGYTREELLAGTIHRDTLTPPEFHWLSQNAMKALQETGASSTYEKEYMHKSGRRIPVLVAVTRIDHTETCIGFVLDISERKELDKRKDEFISMASHELKTPITSLKGFTYVLQRHLSKQGDDQAVAILAKIEKQVDKLTTLINDLLDLSKIETGKLDYREEYFDLDALVREIVENVQGTTHTHRLLVKGQTHAQVFGDKDRIGQVLINLLTNAIKYSPQADKVIVHLSTEQEQAIVSVQDFGIGIAKEYQQSIFDRFYQVADAQERTYPGLGIGLYISSEIIKRHHGKLKVESSKGEGATFSFVLPLTSLRLSE